MEESVRMKHDKKADLIIHSAHMVTMAGHTNRPAIGKQMLEIGLIENGALAIKDGIIVAVGTTKEIEASQWIGSGTKKIDADGKLVTPGFVDPHTHVLYGGSRENELPMKIAGVPYLEILKQGGGILSTVRSTTQAKDQEIKDQTKRRLQTMLSMGTTTVEIKSGYGLTLTEELRGLRLIKELEEDVPLDIVSTFMGAHAVPPGYSENDFSQLVIQEMLPRVASENCAEFCDVFCEPGVFSVENTEKILLKAKELGFKLKLHADELESAGGAECAARLGAVSADHLLKVSEQGIKDMARQGVIAVLLPATSFNLAKNVYAPGRRMVDSGVPVALSTDSNPGSSPTESMLFVLTLACLYLHLSPEEALTAATINAAHAICRAESVGSLEVGKKGDVIIFDAPNLNFIPYRFGYNPVQTVLKEGHLVVERNVFS